MGRYEWSDLNKLQLGRYAEYLFKMEFTMYGCQVYAPEVDDRGIDFVIRTSAGRFLEIQVKSIRDCNGGYVFFPKDKLTLSERLLAAVAVFKDGQPPSMYLIPSLEWQNTNGLLCGRDYPGKKSKPEWGLNLSAKNQKILSAYSFDARIEELV